MYSFMNDYSEGAHPSVLQALVRTNMDQTCGYGLDACCIRAAEQIRTLCAVPEADVHFLVGGTQTNLTVIASVLRPYEAAIAADTGHVNVHETGAIEATGHKVCAVPTPDGKLTPALIEAVVRAHGTDNVEHMVHPRLVYISDTTELGTIYTKSELIALRRCCDDNGLYLYLDGARLGCALTADGNDLTLPDIAALTDAFTIGGTKNGTLFGEAVVLRTPEEHFRWHIKQRGGLLAKGRLLGVQFEALLADDLYFKIARHANEAAYRLRDGVVALGYGFAVSSPSNQQFPILPNDVIAKLTAQGFAFGSDHIVDEARTCVRFVTSWATPMDAVESLLATLAAC